MFALVAAHRLGRLKGFETVQSQPAQNPRDGGRRKARLLGDPGTGEALTAENRDALDQPSGRRIMQAMGTRTAVP